MTPFLFLGEIFYGLGLQVVGLLYRVRIFKTHRLEVPVVSVGNLTWGGTGKTPMVIWLARHFEKKGRRVAVLTRGYGQDEVQLLTERLKPIPILVGPDRIASGKRAIQEHQADLLILDDGYQQWRVQKDLNILLVDATTPFGNGALIPRGTLREPRSAAARADLMVVTKSELNPQGLVPLEQQLRLLNPRASIFFARTATSGCWQWPSGKEVALSRLKQEPICALSGIAQPTQFEATLKNGGMSVGLKIRVRDHHLYTMGEMIRIFQRCHRRGIRRIVTTAKDAIRLPKALLDSLGPDLKGMEILVLEVEMELDAHEGEFLHRIDPVRAG